MEEKEMTLGQRIMAYRTKAHLSQVPLVDAYSAGVDHIAAVPQWKRGASGVAGDSGHVCGVVSCDAAVLVYVWITCAS